MWGGWRALAWLVNHVAGEVGDGGWTRAWREVRDILNLVNYINFLIINNNNFINYKKQFNKTSILNKIIFNFLF